MEIGRICDGGGVIWWGLPLNVPPKNVIWNSYGFHMQFTYGKTPLQHPRHHLIRWPVSVGECLDVDDHFLAHFGAALFGGGAHVR